MTHIWTNKINNSKCILFFNGWGMDENAISHLDYTGYDLCMFNNYSNIGKQLPDLSGYKEIFLVAWSLGVWAASHIFMNSSIPFKKSIAINGTMQPVHNNYGISENVFAGTLERWDNKNRDKFNMRMLGGRQNFSKFTNCLSLRHISDQKNELMSIFKQVKRNNDLNFKWDIAILGKSDAIFPFGNQINAWENKTNIIEKDMPHFPFITFSTWIEIIEAEA